MRSKAAEGPWEGAEVTAGRQSANIWFIFSAGRKMFQLAYLFCFNSVCSLFLAGLGDGDLGFEEYLCA